MDLGEARRPLKRLVIQAKKEDLSYNGGTGKVESTEQLDVVDETARADREIIYL